MQQQGKSSMSRRREPRADQYIASTLARNDTLLGRSPEPEEDMTWTSPTETWAQAEEHGACLTQVSII
jgi:hypothetical protein